MIASSLETTSAARRQALASEWLDEPTVDALIGARGATTQRFRREGRLLGAWIAPEHRYLYPPWQFTGEGQVIAAVQPILAILRSPKGMALSQPTSAGWEEMEWWLAPHVLLEGLSPAESLSADPERVLEVAEQQFSEDPDARW